MAIRTTAARPAAVKRSGDFLISILLLDVLRSWLAGSSGPPRGIIPQGGEATALFPANPGEAGRRGPGRGGPSYCHPIRLRDMGIPYERHGTEGGRLARHSRVDGAEDPGDPGASARLWHRTADRADERRPAVCQLRHAVPGAAQAGAGGVRRVW